MGKKPDDEPKAGRPPRAGEAGGMIGIRVTAAEREEYEAAAKREKMTLAEWIRHACSVLLKKAKR